jgi:hypothetical protein
MSSDAELIGKYSRQGAMLDANLLLLYCLGLSNKSAIPRFKRSNGFTESDFDLLQLVVKRFAKLYTTPHVLTEVSNFVDWLPNNTRENFVVSFREQIDILVECCESATLLSESPLFRRLRNLADYYRF